MINQLLLALLSLAIILGEIVKLPLAGSSSGVLLDLVVGLITLYYLFLNPKIKFSLPAKLGGLFILVAILSLLFSPLHTTINEKLISFSYTLRWGLYLLFGLVTIKLDLKKILMYAGIILSILGLLQLIFIPNLSFLEPLGWDPHFFRVVSTFLDPNFLGAFLVLTLLLIFNSQLKYKWFIFGLVYLSLLLTFSRSAAVMMGGTFISFSIMNRSFKIFLLTGLLLLGFGLTFLIYRQTIASPRGIDRTESAEYRLNTYQEGLSIFEHSPILGIGFNSYRYGLREYNLANQQAIISRGGSTNDSSLIYVLSTTGLVGFLIFLSFLGGIIWVNRSNFLFLAFLIGLLVDSFFINSLFYPFLLLPLMSQLRLYRSQLRSPDSASHKK